MEDKNRFVELLKSTKRDGIEELLQYLEITDFYTAPASTKYHSDKEGGLVAHSLNVYDAIMTLISQTPYNHNQDFINSATLVSLLHDVSKAEFYEEYIANRKVYDPAGSKRDEFGSFDWVAVKDYRIKSPENREVLGDHGFNSYHLVNHFVPLSKAETAAILNHHAGMDNNYVLKDLNEIYNRYPLASLLHLADMYSCYIIENPNVNESNN